MGTSDAYNHLSSNDLNEISFKYQAWSKAVIKHAERGVPANCRSFSFSDCIYLSYPWCRNKECTEKRLLWIYFLSGFAQTEAIRMGMLVRGGVGQGNTVANDNGLSGPGVIQAYVHESQKAKMPRISIASSAQLGIKTFPTYFDCDSSIRSPSLFNYAREKNILMELINCIANEKLHTPNKYTDWMINNLQN